MVNITATNYFQDANNLTSLLEVSNKVTGGWAYAGLLFMFQVIMILALINFGFETAILTSAFIILIAGLFLNYLGLVSWQVLMFFLAQILFMIMYITWNNKNDN